MNKQKQQTHRKYNSQVGRLIMLGISEVFREAIINGIINVCKTFVWQNHCHQLALKAQHPFNNTHLHKKHMLAPRKHNKTNHSHVQTKRRTSFLSSSSQYLCMTSRIRLNNIFDTLEQQRSPAPSGDRRTQLLVQL